MKNSSKLLIIFGIIFTICGIIGILTPTRKYEAPIYISSNFRLEYRDDGRYNTIGEFTNLTQNDVVIDSISFKLYGESHYANATLSNITVPAGDKCYVNEYVFSYPYDLLEKIKITSCTINGTDAKVEYSEDGITFSSSYDRPVAIGTLILGLICSIVPILAYHIKKKKIKY